MCFLGFFFLLKCWQGPVSLYWITLSPKNGTGHVLLHLRSPDTNHNAILLLSILTSFQAERPGRSRSYCHKVSGCPRCQEKLPNLSCPVPCTSHHMSLSSRDNQNFPCLPLTLGVLPLPPSPVLSLWWSTVISLLHHYGRCQQAGRAGLGEEGCSFWQCQSRFGTANQPLALPRVSPTLTLFLLTGFPTDITQCAIQLVFLLPRGHLHFCCLFLLDAPINKNLLSQRAIMDK